MVSASNFSNCTYHSHLAVSRTLKDVRARIPERLFERNTAKALVYAVRDLLLALVFFALACRIDQICADTRVRSYLGPVGCEIVRYSLWMV